MKQQLKDYYDAALNTLETDDDYLNGYIQALKKAVRMLGDEVLRLEAALEYIRDSDSGVVPGGFHETVAEKALKGEKVCS